MRQTITFLTMSAFAMQHCRKCKGIKGLTATSYQVQGGVENEYLKKNKFSLIDSRISNTTEEAELLPIKLEDFFSNSQDRPLLIFC